MNEKKISIKDIIIKEVNKIPKGRVTNFGHIASSLKENYGIFVTAQMVGWTLSGMKESEWSLCPWQRVVARDGYISSLKLGVKGMVQKELLKNEGVEILNDTVDMAKYGWFELINGNHLL